MYADLVEAQANRSIKERMSGNSTAGSSRRRPISGKRQREDDDKWEHDLFEGNGPQLSNPRVGVKDLRLKLQRKSMEEATQNTRATAFSGARDLREKLSGTLYSRPIDSQPHRNTIAAISEIPARETKISGLVSKKTTQQKVERVDSFLQSLGLEKYSVAFQAEEVDMTALVHMGEEDLKTMGIPMGPRKKILLALESKV